MIRYSKRFDLKTNLFTALALILVLGIILFILERTNVINLYRNDERQGLPTQGEEKTTSTAPTAQEDFNEGNFREPGNSLNEGEGSGILTDNNGNIGSNVSTNNPQVSNTGEITVYSPKKEAKITSGYEVSGLSSLDTVYYRLGDDISGMIAQGQIKVVNGRFSGNLIFNTNAQTGRLDLYGAKSDGVEFSNVEIPIEF